VNATAAIARGRSAAIRLGALALSAGVATLAGCSAPAVSVNADPVGAVRDAAAASQKIHTAKVATTVDMAVQGKSRTFVGNGEFDFDKQVGDILLQTPAGAAPLDEIVTPTTLYLRENVQGAQWKWVDATKLPDGDLISAGYTSPVFDFALLRGVGDGDAHYVGQDTVRGADVAHYTGTLDLTTSAAAADNPIKGELLAAAHSFAEKTVPFDAYLDAQGRVRRVVAHFSFPAQAPDKGMVQITATTDLFGLDQPVTVVTPPVKNSAVTPPSASAAH
jgi:hypothetical protein